MCSGTSIDARVQTLVHERIHVMQRHHAALCHDMYKRYWSLVPVAAEEVACARGHNPRSNPDLDGYVWVHAKSGVGCRSCFPSESPTSLGEARAVGLCGKESDCERRRVLKNKTCNYEHPNEALAYILASLIVPVDDPPGRAASEPRDAMFPQRGVEAWLRDLT
jgi:hypothetical protein